MDKDKIERKTEEIQNKLLELMKENAKTAQHSQRALWMPISITLMVILFIGGIAWLLVKLFS